MAGQPGFFDLSDRYEALSAAGDPLERLTSVVDFEVFRGLLVAALRRSVRGKGGRPPFDPGNCSPCWLMAAWSGDGEFAVDEIADGAEG